MAWAKYIDILHKEIELNRCVHSVDECNGTKVSSCIYESDYILRSRETLIEDARSSIYNNIIYPNSGSDMPCLGMDLMAFSEQKVVIVFDLQHPRENQEINDPFFVDKLSDYLDNTKDSIKFFEPGNHFSRYLFVRKCRLDQVNDYLSDFAVYVKVYSDALRRYKPSGKDYGVYKVFDDYMRALDPVEGYLTHKFGKDFARKYVDEFLFPVQQ